jgi:hypothetical protein
MGFLTHLLEAMAEVHRFIDERASGRSDQR